MATLFRCLAIISVLLLVGCGSSPVADDLSQRDANRIVAALRGKGVDSSTEKERGSRGRYTVVVSSADFAKAATFLAELGLPEERQASFSELVASSGFLPSSREVEALRLDRALAAEMEELLRGHPAIAEAHVVVRYHSLSEGGVSTISAVVQKRAGSTVAPDDVRVLVSRALPNVRHEDIVVAVADQRVSTPADEGQVEVGHETVPFLVYWRVPPSEYNGLASLLIGLLLFVACLAGLGGYIFGQYTLTKQHVLSRADLLSTNSTVSQPQALSKEKNVEDEE